jgi:hypothetical protein
MVEQVGTGKLEKRKQAPDPEHEAVEFLVRCQMKRRWARQFLAMLEYMRLLGSIGSSRRVTFYADGDGDFRPMFTYDPKLCPDPSAVVPAKEERGDRTYDAG